VDPAVFFFLSDASPFYTFASLLLVLRRGSAMRDGTCAVRDSQRMFGPRCDAYMGEGNEDIARWSQALKEVLLAVVAGVLM
jgi:hypothetical protein